jgi:hypothetical protein
MASLIDVTRQFGTDEACLAYLEAMRWPSGLACLKCGSVKVAKTASTVKNRRTGKVSKTRYLYDCLEAECRHQFTATTGTIFHDSHLPLSKWFLAVTLMCDGKKSISALQLQRSLGIGSYRTAWYLAHRIRKAMEQGGSSPFTGQVEADETFIGGKYDKRRNRKPWDKQAVVGMLERSQNGEPSKVRAFPIKRASKTFLTGAVRDNVSPEAALLCTDQSRSYKSLGCAYRHEVGNHIREEYVRRSGDALISTYGIENFWSLFKRGLVGQFHNVSIKHLSPLLDEFTFRFSDRGSADLFNLTVGRMLETIGMPYRQLVSE